jgi:hypothetical protein
VDQRSPEIDTRVSIRYAIGDRFSELVGFVTSVDAAGLRVQHRDGSEIPLLWAQIQHWRRVGVARGRDPLRTPKSELDQLAAAAGVTGQTFVIRLSQLLDASAPAPGSGVNVQVIGEWATIAGSVDLLPAAWWAARQDARSLQVRTSDPSKATELLALGFTEVKQL